MIEFLKDLGMGLIMFVVPFALFLGWCWLMFHLFWPTFLVTLLVVGYFVGKEERDSRRPVRSGVTYKSERLKRRK